jgi:hypothetical protein
VDARSHQDQVPLAWLLARGDHIAPAAGERYADADISGVER